MPRSASPDGMTDDEEEEFKRKSLNGTGSWASDDEDGTLAGSRMSKKPVGTFRKAKAATEDLELGQIGRGRGRLPMSSLGTVCTLVSSHQHTLTGFLCRKESV